jgi:hypothetical protein
MERPVEYTEEGFVVTHPVKRRRAEDAIESRLERHMQEVTQNKLNAIAEIRCEIVACCVEHVLRNVKGDDVPARQSFQQITCQAARAATGVENRFIAA